MAAKGKSAKKSTARPKDLKPKKAAAKAVKGGSPNIYPMTKGINLK